MKWILVAALGLAALGLVHYLMLPWYFDGVLVFVMGLFVHPKWWAALLSGWLVTAVVWGVHIYFLMASNSDLPERLAQMFGLSDAAQLFWVVVLAGGFWGGLGSLAGWSFRALWVKSRQRRFKR
jgi:hypothetical protein